MANQAVLEHRTEAAPKRFLLQRSPGWVGIDVGTSMIKLAQVERTGNEWSLVAGRILPIPAPRRVDEAALAAGLVGSLVGPIIRGEMGFRGRRAACTLPMSVTGLQSFDLPPGTDAELRQMIVQEFVSSGDDVGDAREIAFWKTPQPANERHELSQVTALSLPRRVAAGVGEDLLQSKLHCQVLDGLPFALARAVGMVSRDATNQPQAAVDWSYTSPLFTVVVDGRPVFARTLRDRGLKQLLESMAKRLTLSLQECEQLLIAYGPASSTPDARSGHAGDVLSQFTDQPLQEFAREIQKTLMFLRQQHSGLSPGRIWLFGGGATIRHAAEHIATAVGIETQVWQLSSRHSAAGAHLASLQPLLGSAMALSALGVSR